MKVQSTKGFGVDRIKMIIVGRSGHGKTTLAGTIQEPTLVISAESGLLVLKEKQIDFVDVTTDDEGQIIPRHMRGKRIGEALGYIQKKDVRDKYKWVFVDSLTEIGTCIFQGIEKEMKDEAIAEGKKFDGRQVYGEFAKQMAAFITVVRDLPYYNVVFTCLPEEKEDENGVTVIKMMLQGRKSNEEIPALIDEVFYLLAKDKDDNSGEKDRIIFTRPMAKVPFLKDRSGALEAQEPADLQLIIDKIRGTKAKTKESK